MNSKATHINWEPSLSTLRKMVREGGREGGKKGGGGGRSLHADSEHVRCTVRTRRAKPSISPLGQEGLGGSEGSREGRKEARTDGRTDGRGEREQKILWKSLISLMIHEEAFSPPLLKISLLPPSSSLSSPTEVLGSSPPLKLESQPARARSSSRPSSSVGGRSI